MSHSNHIAKILGMPSLAGNAGEVLTVNGTEDGFIFTSSSGSPARFGVSGEDDTATTNRTFDADGNNFTLLNASQLEFLATNIALNTLGGGGITSIGPHYFGLENDEPGVLVLYGGTSGAVTLQTAANAGNYTLTLPTTDGASGEFLQTDGSGVLTWAAASDTNFATHDLTLTGLRQHDGDGFEMVLSNFDSLQFHANEILMSADGTNSYLNMFVAGATTLASNGYISLTSPEIRINDATLAAANNGYVWTLIDDTTGEGGWAAGGGSVTPAALTKTDDTNVTLTLGGSPSTALLQATSLTLGWSGQLSLARGGTGANLSDPGDDRIMFWDDSAGAVTWLTVGTGLAITTTTLNNTGVLSADNGLHVESGVVHLGGVLIEDTIIGDPEVEDHDLSIYAEDMILGTMATMQLNAATSMTIAPGTLFINNLTNDDTKTEVLVRDAATFRVYYRDAASLGGGSTAGSITIQLYNGGSDLTTGIKDVPIQVPYGAEITGWEIMAYDNSNALLSTSCVVDVLSDTFANLPLAGTDSIAGSEKPTLSGASTASDNTITTWTDITAGNYIQAEIESVNAGVKRIVITLKLTKL